MSNIGEPLNSASIPVLNPKLSVSKLSLTPKEGFVLSRVDGSTSIEQISSISGIPLPETTEMFAKFLANGAVSLKEPKERKKVRNAENQSILEQLDDDENYETLQGMPRQERREILMLEEDISRLNHYDLLRVKRGVGPDKLKKAYFELSKQFHPDKYFGKEIGIYKKKLERIFNALTEAYGTLSDDIKRKKYDAGVFPDEAKEKTREETEFKGAPKTLIEKLAYAKRYFKLGNDEVAKKNFISAASYFNMALALDPSNEEYKRAFDRAKPALDKKKAKVKYDEAVGYADRGSYDHAIGLLEEALKLEPNSGLYNFNMAKLLFSHKNDYPKAMEHCLKSLESMPNDPEVRLLMGRIYKKNGMQKNAEREFKLVLKLDKENKTAKMELENLG